MLVVVNFSNKNVLLTPKLKYIGIIIIGIGIGGIGIDILVVSL